MNVIQNFFYQIFTIISNVVFSIYQFLIKIVKWFSYPAVNSFSPLAAYSGSIIDIEGFNFSPLREGNEVTIGGVTARVIEASENKLKVISAIETVTGKIRVTVNGKPDSSFNSFVVKPYPLPGDGDDGPPIMYGGTGFPSSGDVPPTGTMRVLICLVNPTDRVPASPAAARTTVINTWDNVSDFYQQVSYNALNVQIDVFNAWHTLSEDFNYYIDPAENNIKFDVLSQLMAEAVDFAQNTENFNLDDYQMFACVINLDGTGIRAWGGGSTNNFRYDPLGINITTTDAINELWIQETADWGRCAHETGHNIVARPSGLSANDDFAEKTLGEDIYDSDLIDPAAASAQRFDMMGDHDTHPMFSAYHMEKTGWYDSANIREFVWDRNPFSQEFNVIAHGVNRDTVADRFHLLKIKVGDGLFYYVEVRQQPQTVSPEYIYDTNIPVAAGTNGGVVITKVVTDVVNNNQQMRFISLLHDERVLRQGEFAEDPARALKITVTNDNVAARPLVCRVRLEWSQEIADDPAGQFDLRIEPWDSNYQTPDIWIDRSPFGTFDQGNDSAGRPVGNGDKPRPQEINKYFTRIHNDGAIAVNNIKATFYAINPPGVGDNGNWTPLKTETISTINNNSFTDISTNWVPILGEHTCLKVFISQQSGEITGGNNFAQENVFDFEAPAGSVPQPVYIPVAIRNPLEKRTLVRISIKGVKIGYVVQFPHEWVWLDALEEKSFYLTVVPYFDYPVYRDLPKRFKQKDNDFASKLNIAGYIPKQYEEEIDITGFPGSKLEKIGGIFANVKPKKKVSIRIQQERKDREKSTVTVIGGISENIDKQTIRMQLRSPLFDDIYKNTMTNGSGRFIVRFELEEVIKSLIRDGKIADEKDFVDNANMVAQSFVFNASDTAEAASNIINVQ